MTRMIDADKLIEDLADMAEAYAIAHDLSPDETVKEVVSQKIQTLNMVMKHIQQSIVEKKNEA